MCSEIGAKGLEDNMCRVYCSTVLVVDLMFSLSELPSCISLKPIRGSPSDRVRITLRARTLLVAPGLTTSNKKLLGAPGIPTSNKKLLGAKGLATRNKDATRAEVLQERADTPQPAVRSSARVAARLAGFSLAKTTEQPLPKCNRASLSRK